MLRIWSRQYELQSKLPVSEVLARFAENSQPEVEAYRNSQKPFVGVVQESPFRLRYRERVRKHKLGSLILELVVVGRVSAGLGGSSVLITTRPAFEQYVYPTLAFVVGIAFQSAGLLVLAAIIAAAQIPRINRISAILRRDLEDVLAEEGSAT